MPLPLIIGAAALAAASYGAKKGYDGYQKHSEADEIIKDADSKYKRKKRIMDDQENDTQVALQKLGDKKLKIGKEIGDFKKIADALIKRLAINSKNADLNISIPPSQLQKIEAYSLTAIGVMSTVAGAGAAGAAAGFAVYGGVMGLGAASTGTAISALSGAAATNATLAAIGGGSLASGGLGIAGGTAVLGAAVAAPVLAIAGWAYDSHGEEALKNARKISREVDQAIKKMDKARETLISTEEYADRIRRLLTEIFDQFQGYHESLREIDDFLSDIQGREVDVDKELNKFNDNIMRTIGNGYTLAEILVSLCTTPIFKLATKDGEIITDENGAPKIETNEDGINIINESGINEAIHEQMAKYQNVDKID